MCTVTHQAPAQRAGQPTSMTIEFCGSTVALLRPESPLGHEELLMGAKVNLGDLVMRLSMLSHRACSATRLVP